MKLILTAFSVMLITVCSFAEGIFVKTGSRPGDGFDVSLRSSNAERTSLSAEFSGFYREDLQYGTQIFQKLSVKEAVSLGEPGEASLPVVTKFIQIPNGKNVRVEIRNSSYVDFAGISVSPYSALPLRNSIGLLAESPVSGEYYLRDSYNPESPVSIKEIAVFRDVRVAVVSIHPLLFNPANITVRAFTNIEFDLVYEGQSSMNNVTSNGDGLSRSFEKMYKQLIMNYEAPDHFTVAPKLLVLVADALYDGVLPVRDWKQRKGISTTVVRKSEIAGIPSPTAEQVKAYLTQLYNSPDRPEFVLIVGDASGTNTFPWFTATGGKSDHPYQCLDGTDILPDIVVGRISVQTLPELDSAVSKLIQYERQPNTQQTDWYKRAIVLHSNDGIDPVNGQVAKRVFENEGGFDNVELVNNSFTQSQITALINQGVSWIWFIGHGSSTSWADPVWSMNNMVNLNFGKKQPSIVSIACSNADLDYSTTNNCFGEAWIERERGNSASNIAASTELCAFYTTDTIGREMLYSYFRHGIRDFGSMLNFGKIKAYQYFNGNGTVTETINQFMVLGDPSQEAFSSAPKTVSVTSSLSGNFFTVNVKTEGENVKGSLVALHQSDLLKASGYTDSLGNYTIDKSLLTESLPVTGVITGTNLLPFEGTLTLTSVNTFAGNAEEFRLMQNYPNPFNPSTLINFSLPERTFATLKVYDMLGRQVAQLVNGYLDRGSYSVDFNASSLPAGVYLYRLEAGNRSETMKMTLVK